MRSDDLLRSSPAGALSRLTPASTLGIGGLPHRNARQAAEFALDEFDVPTIPSLPRRSPAESPIAQALVGVSGVCAGQYGTVAIDASRLDPSNPVRTDLGGDQFVGFRTFLDVAAERRYAGPVTWHLTGPISAGVALIRAGAAPDVAFEVALATVRSHLRALAAAVTEALPDVSQIVIIDEPLAEVVTDRGFPLTREQTVDLVSSAMAAVEPVATVGVHCCSKVDVAVLLAAGPQVVSMPVTGTVLDLAGYLDRYLAGGGWVAWGAVATGGPVGVTANRAWHHLTGLWQDLARRGCSLQLLRDQSLLTPECGLSGFGVPVAERICHSLRDIGRALRSEATTTKFLLEV